MSANCLGSILRPSSEESGEDVGSCQIIWCPEGGDKGLRFNSVCNPELLEDFKQEKINPSSFSKDHSDSYVKNKQNKDASTNPTIQGEQHSNLRLESVCGLQVDEILKESVTCL